MLHSEQAHLKQVIFAFVLRKVFFFQKKSPPNIKPGGLK